MSKLILTILLIINSIIADLYIARTSWPVFIIISHEICNIDFQRVFYIRNYNIGFFDICLSMKNKALV